MKRIAIILAVLFLTVIPAFSALEYVWVEGEKPTGIPSFGANPDDPNDKGWKAEGWGNTEFLSEGKVLHVSIGNKQLGMLPSDGATFSWSFNVKSDGNYELHARIGYERVRAPFDWRIDGGSWKTVESSALTRDWQLLRMWNEIAWYQLGEANLSSGKHTIEVRVRPDGGKKPRVLFFVDAFCFTKGKFYPNGKFKPGENYENGWVPSLANRLKYNISVDSWKTVNADAARNKFVVKAAEGAERQATELTGLWQIARWDEWEGVPENTRYSWPKTLPDDLEEFPWYGIPVPAERNEVRQDHELGHRMLYRTKVEVPASAKGRGMYLDFHGFGMIAAVFVNGVYCGGTRVGATDWKCDITKGVKAGEVNDIIVLLKDMYYSHPGNGQNGARDVFHMAPSFTHSQGFTMACDSPYLNGHIGTGIVQAVDFVISGEKVYASDVFAIPSVKNKTLSLEVTITNTTTDTLSVTVENECVPYEGGKAEKTFSKKSESLSAYEGKVLKISEKWENPNLWWPDDPKQYFVVTTVSVDGKVVDIRKTKFGFREWEWKNSWRFSLNGVPWHIMADLAGFSGGDLDKNIAHLKENNVNMIRAWQSGAGWGTRWNNGNRRMSDREALDKYDAAGILVRRTGVLDGQVMSYKLTEDGKPRKILFDYYYEYIEQLVRNERNHPSIQIWNIENEITFININNGNQWEAEPAVAHAGKICMDLDPTRPVMIDGGWCQKNHSPYLPVIGGHYDDTAPQVWLPDIMYSYPAYWAKNGERAWTMPPDKRPFYHGEIYFMNGWQPADYSAFGGEQCFIGPTEATPARDRYARWMHEGLRWEGNTGAWHVWGTQVPNGEAYNAMSPVAVFCREWNWSFGAKSKVERTLKVFNNTQHKEPLEVEWLLEVGGRKASSEKKEYTVAPGGASEEIKITLDVPEVRGATEIGKFILTCSRGGKEIYRDEREVRILNNNENPMPKASKEELLIFDPARKAISRLQERGIAFTEITVKDARAGKLFDIKKHYPKAKAVIIGPKGVPESRATDQLWLNLVASGIRLLVLEQKNPLKYSAVSGDLEVSDQDGRIAFIEDNNHPAFRNMTSDDFYTWDGGHIVYRSAYTKPTKGARSLLQCGFRLQTTALVEYTVNDGLGIVCQAMVGTKLGEDAAATRLFDNMVAYITEYTRLVRKSAVVMEPSDLRASLLKDKGLNFAWEGDPVKAVKSGKYQIVIVDANPENLKKLASSKKDLEKYYEEGGWLMLWGLTPEGLDSYNEIVGFTHSIRPFRREKVILSIPADALMAGITLTDAVMRDNEKINPWAGELWHASDTYTYVVDHTDIASFCEFPPASYWGYEGTDPSKSDNDPLNMVNGFLSDVTWKYIFSIHLMNGDPTEWVVDLPREEELVSFGIVLNAIYHKVTKINLYFDNDPKPATIEIPANLEDGARIDFPVEGKKAKKIKISLAEWASVGRADVIGVDNLWFGIKRSEEYMSTVKSLLNIGTLMKYSKGNNGGIVLNQLNIQATEPRPENAAKKAKMATTILGNLGAEFKGGAAILPGMKIDYEYVDIPTDKFNVFLSRGTPLWYSGGPGDMSHLPLGEQKFAGVKYKILDFTTSPVPSCIMLHGMGSGSRDASVTGIPVNKKADALFFLQTVNASSDTLEWKPQLEKTKGKGSGDAPLMFKYIVHYEDGTTEEIPVYWKDGVAHWLQKSPEGAKSAALAWAGGWGSGDLKATLYSMQWSNPKPDKMITTIDMVHAESDRRNADRLGAPALLAITAAKMPQ